MGVDERAAVILDRALAGDPTVRSQGMFGGIGFMRHGHMLCGAMSDKMGGGAMFRVGPEQMPEALAIEGVGPFDAAGRSMTGFVAVPTEVIEDEAMLERLLELAGRYVGSLPPK
ncbi:MAG TPA: TfoX/Sxy family protein [Thermohalobaculum sp.]|nr:TfoX/Sxy family protein [Thermohalobaculum sp.]